MTPKNEALQAVRARQIDAGLHILREYNELMRNNSGGLATLYALEAQLTEVTLLLHARAEAHYAKVTDGFLENVTLGRTRDVLPKVLDEVERAVGALPDLRATVEVFLLDAARASDAKGPVPEALSERARRVTRAALTRLLDLESVAARLEAFAAVKEAIK